VKPNVRYVMVPPTRMPTVAWTDGQLRAVFTAFQLLRKAGNRHAVTASDVAAVCQPTISNAVARRALRQLHRCGVLAATTASGSRPQMFYARAA
jgi:response regulator of citrate/malate metabolism